MLQKIFKVIGIIILAIIGVILLFLAIVWAALEWGQASKKQERITYQKEVCDTMTVVNQEFTFNVSGFSKKELKQVSFYLVRHHQVLQNADATVSINPGDKYQSVTMPFKNIKTSDTVILQVAKRSFLLSGLSYIAYQNYGMFGPVGPCDCGLHGFEMLNGKARNTEGWLIKDDAILNYRLPKSILK